MTLDALFKEARRYGKVYIHTHDDGTYSCKIACMTPQYVFHGRTTKKSFFTNKRRFSRQDAPKAAKEYVKL